MTIAVMVIASGMAVQEAWAERSACECKQPVTPARGSGLIASAK
jgi:hypothetical protein